MGNSLRILLIGALAVASMATSRIEDDPVDANPAADADPSAADADPGAPDAAPDEYTAAALIGALDRIVIIKADRGLDVCAVLLLVYPASSSNFGITTPTGWGVEQAGISQGTTDCLATQFPSTSEFSMGGTGMVTFTVPAGMIYPTTLSADATITFDTTAAPSWVPASVTFDVTDLPVQ